MTLVVTLGQALVVIVTHDPLCDPSGFHCISRKDMNQNGFYSEYPFSFALLRFISLQIRTRKHLLERGEPISIHQVDNQTNFVILNQGMRE